MIQEVAFDPQIADNLAADVPLDAARRGPLFPVMRNMQGIYLAIEIQRKPVAPHKEAAMISRVAERF
jgi:hypothetical protein